MSVCIVLVPEDFRLPSVSIADECITTYKQVRSGRGAKKPTFVIYRISDDQTAVVVEDSSAEQDFEAFRHKLCSTVDSRGNPAPRYAVYDVEYDLGDDGKRCKTVFISWVPASTPLKLCMLYASTKEQLRSALDVKLSIHADTPDEIEWKTVLSVASGGKA
ncbi:cofilin [Aspergillus flavus]|uniref:Cofilin n=1 Tax=Aspergillus flavus TaxID=5059 RepID=A0AB74BTR5_ASPFL|nr:cofilin [Aspergillus flavus]